MIWLEGGVKPMRLLSALLLAGIAMAGDVSFTIAGLRVTPERWNKHANLAKIERYAREAAAQGANVVVTPEGFLEGYVGNKSANKDLTREKYFAIGETIEGPMLSRIRELARELKIYLLVGFAERRDEQMFNSLVIFSPEGASCCTTRNPTTPMTSRTTRPGWSSRWSPRRWGAGAP